MYGKRTRVRFAEEAAWGQTPEGGWVEAQAIGAKVDVSPRVTAARTAIGGVPGTAYGSVSLDVAPTAANVSGLAAAALLRDADGQMNTYSLEGGDDSGAWLVAGAAVRRLVARTGLARAALELSVEMVGKPAVGVSPFPSQGAAGRPFTFGGASCHVSGETVPLKELLLSVNNNIFLGGVSDDGEPAFITAGRQEVTGYIVTSEDRRDLIDDGEHSIVIALPGDGGSALLTATSVIFTWVRESRTLSHGAMQVLYFEGATGSITGGVSLALTA